MTDILPELAISVRQPWAWAIIHGGKDIENRSPCAVQFMKPLKGRRAIHASKGMTREEYEDARNFMASIGITCPKPAEIARGCITGSVEVVDVVSKSESPWFFGPRGLVLRDPKPCKLIPCSGELGYFRWKEADPSVVPPPARWMLPAESRQIGKAKAASIRREQADLFGGAA